MGGIVRSAAFIRNALIGNSSSLRGWNEWDFFVDEAPGRKTTIAGKTSIAATPGMPPGSRTSPTRAVSRFRTSGRLPRRCIRNFRRRCRTSRRIRDGRSAHPPGTAGCPQTASTNSSRRMAAHLHRTERAHKSHKLNSCRPAHSRHRNQRFHLEMYR